ncbi:AraC family transcriptional regulator [Streptomyces spongiae]|uniref:AraC family transcriptional regulator n=1 Tax=Streptomyces spongiae TaxID=565072 RepID=A0A5N8X932_9ACTN|nr:AraC family transcriptional regulator [Streptomyces spongiae]MPY55867.1 AraC family transcriptional regulator [Streptomyces spongiae]
MTRPPAHETTAASIAPHIIRYLMLVAEESGVSLEAIVEAAGLSSDLLDARGLRVSFRQGRQVIESAMAALPVPALGIAVGLRQPITSTGMLGMGMMSCATVRDAIDLGVRYQYLAGSMVHSWTSDETSSVALIAEVHGASPQVDEFLIDEAFANVTRMARDLTGPEFCPERVELARAVPADSRPYAECFRSPVVFGAGRNAWIVSKSACRTPISTADRWACAEARSLLDDEVAEAMDLHELVAVLSTRVEEALPRVVPLEGQARVLALSQRTLRRRLAALDMTYSTVVDEVRRRMFSRLIRHHDLLLADIARQLGYTDERSLRRAVRRWFGQSASELRESGPPS